MLNSDNKHFANNLPIHAETLIFPCKNIKGELKAKISIFFNIFFGKLNICKVRFVELFLPFSRLLRENYA